MKEQIAMKEDNQGIMGVKGIDDVDDEDEEQMSGGEEEEFDPANRTTARGESIKQKRKIPIPKGYTQEDIDGLDYDKYAMNNFMAIN